MTDERTGQSPKPIPCDAMRYDPIQIRDSDPDPKRETHVATTRSSHDMYIHICMCLYEIKMGRDEVVWNGGGGEGRTNGGDCLGYQRESQLLSDKENICLFEQINNSALAVLHTHYTYIYICYKHYMSIIFHILLHHCFVPAFQNKIKNLFKFCFDLSTWVFINSALHIYPSIPLSFMSTARVRSSFGAFAIRLCLCTLLLITHHIVAIVAIAIYVSFCCVCCSAGRQLICILIPAHTRSRRLI